MPAMLTVVLLVPAALACGSSQQTCNCFYLGPQDGGSLADASVGTSVPCSGENAPLFKDPSWSCGFV